MGLDGHQQLLQALVLAGEMLVEELGGQGRFGRVVWEEKAET
jgi:hypothetical protein